ncbi:hypothetical protein OROHE_015103 [Orobanche hederae]
MSVESIYSSSLPIDTNALRSRIAELRNVEENSGLGTEEENLLNVVAEELEYSTNLNEILEQLKSEVVEVEAQSIDMECEIEKLQRRCVEDYGKMESELEKLRCSLEIIEPQNLGKANKDMQIDTTCPANHQMTSPNGHSSNFKMLDLSLQIEKSKMTLKSLQDLDSVFKRFEVIEKIEDSLTGLRVIEVKGNSIRLSLNTYIPYLDTVLPQQDIDTIIEPVEINHELNIETVDGTLELKNVEIFPNDVYVGEILGVAKTSSSGQLCPTLSLIDIRSPLEFFVRRVMDRIALSSLRRFVVKNANKSRHSFRYMDREDIIVAHLVGGIDAFIKLPQGWPLSDLALELISIKSTSQNSEELSLSFLCEITAEANSLDKHLRQKIRSFADSIEEILMQQTRAQLHAARILNN